MKTISKTSLALALLATLGISSALADDQQLQNRLALQRAQSQPRWEWRWNGHGQRSLTAVPSGRTTIGVFAGKRGIGAADRTQTRWEWRWNAHGERFLIAVPNR